MYNKRNFSDRGRGQRRGSNNSRGGRPSSNRKSFSSQRKDSKPESLFIKDDFLSTSAERKNGFYRSKTSELKFRSDGEKKSFGREERPFKDNSNRNFVRGNSFKKDSELNSSTRNNSERSNDRGFRRSNNSFQERSEGGFQRRGFSQGGRGGNFRDRNGFRGRGGRNRRAIKGIDASKFVKKATGKTVVEKPVIQNKFDDFKINDILKKNIKEKGFVSPTPIQDQAIPHIIEGKDVVGIANTGTGKTGAFIIPLINKVSKNRNSAVLIIAPTRELATQINDEFKQFVRGQSIFSVTCIGGTNIRNQTFMLRRNHNFVIGTPGRLKDLVERRALNLKEFDSIVLDEVDRMMDMGFIDDIKFLIGQLKKDRQSLFFSATMPKEVQELMRQFLKPDHITVSVKTGDTSDNVDQDVIRVSHDDEKLNHLEEMLKDQEFDKVLIFVRTKIGVDKLANHLYDHGFKIAAIHGDKPQYKRDKAIKAFKANQVKILIATDVAARGLDVPNVSHVINFDAPENYEDYVHRIGRTGRADKTGKALTFVKHSHY